MSVWFSLRQSNNLLVVTDNWGILFKLLKYSPSTYLLDMAKNDLSEDVFIITQSG